MIGSERLDDFQKHVERVPAASGTWDGSVIGDWSRGASL